MFEIKIRLGLEGIVITPRQSVLAAQILRGKKVGEALGLVPKLFSLCGTAQKEAATNALRNAAGLEALPPSKEAIKEIIRENGTRFLLDWPQNFGILPRIAAVKALRQGSFQPFIEEFLGLAPEEWLDGNINPQSLSQEIARKIKDKGWENLGSQEIIPLPSLNKSELSAKMADDQFLACPKWNDSHPESGPFARYFQHPLIASYGTGVLARFYARILETVLYLLDETVAKNPEIPHIENGKGLGFAYASRGDLAHRIIIKDGIIADYRILAPTEWNFHPKGPLYRGLQNCPKEANMEEMLRLLVLALDPCVACEIVHA